MNVLIFGNCYLHEVLPQVDELVDALLHSGARVALEQSFHDWAAASALRCASLPSAPAGAAAQADLLVSLGGDGTLLHTAHATASLSKPILGLNAGHLGYLTAASLARGPQVVAEIAAGHYRLEQRMMLQVSCDAVDIASPYALNEVALLRQDAGSVIEMETLLRGEPLTTYVGDGLVISTPTGSTAYNMSAGGPILEPTTSCMVLSPVSPHALTMRPLVVRDDSRVTITTRSRASHYMLSLDGNSMACPAGSTVTVWQAPHRVHIIMPGESNFAATLRQKLLWGK